MRHSVKQLSKGLYLSGQVGTTPPGYLRRARGISALSTGSVKSRDGSAAIDIIANSANAHSAVYYNDFWFMGLGTTVKIEGVWGAVSHPTTLSGDRLSFTPMPPTAGIEDHLFICGGGTGLKVGPPNTSLVIDNVYKWTASSDEWYMEIEAGGDPPIREPRYITENGTPMQTGLHANGSLVVGEWFWASDTVYVRLSDDADPNGKEDGYLLAGYRDLWGINPPENIPTLATNAAGDLTGTYKYRFTYKNSQTGSRSNALVGEDNFELALLLHMNGADEGTTFTDLGYYTHTFTQGGHANTEQATKKFGTASLELDGTGDYITTPNSPILNPGNNTFSIDCWARFDDVTTAKSHPLFSKYFDADNYFYFYVVTGAGTADYLYFQHKANGILKAWALGAITIAINTFYHFALIRGWEGDPNKWAICHNGSAVATWTRSIGLSNYGDFEIGGYNDGTYSLDGFIDEFRFKNGTPLWTEDSTVPTAAMGTATIILSSDSTDMSAIPSSPDAQVDTVEIWRTVANGSVFFKLADIDNGSTTYGDNAADALLQSEELPLDNIKPYDWFEDSIYNNASAFWLTRTQTGQKGRVYYSPIGRCEAVEGFINVTTDDDTLQKFVYWSGMLLVFSESGLFQILGTNPYTARRIAGVPGTNSPHTVIPTANGVFYEASDGVRIFLGGTNSILLYYDAIKPIFRGLSAGQLTSFTGVVATYARNEYIISDTSQTLAVDVITGRWRDLGLACNCLHYSPESNEIGAGAGTNKFYDIEKEGSADDNGTDITFEIEVPAIIEPHPEADVVCQRVVIDADTGNEVLECALVVDGTEYDLGDVQHNGRKQSEFPANKTGIEFSVRLSGSLDASAQCVEVFEVAFDLYDPVRGK